MARERRTERRSDRSRSQTFTPRECRFCKDQVLVDFTQSEMLKKFMTDNGRILPRRFTGNCAKHQRELTTAIKRARSMLISL